MIAKAFVAALCVGSLALAGCNETTTAPSALSEKPATNDLRLCTPSLEYVPCGHSVCVGWELDVDVPSARIDVEVWYYDLVDAPVVPTRRRAMHELEGEIYQLVATQELGKDLRGCGTCRWNTPNDAYDRAVLHFTVKNARRGNDSFTREFLVGEVRPRNQHPEPRQRLK